MRRKRILCLSGSDPSGGAGLQADLKTIAVLGHYGMAVPTALTTQNTRGVFEVVGVPSDFVGRQLRAVLEDLGADIVKVGVLHNASVVREVATALKQFNYGPKGKPVVLDPVVRPSAGGEDLLDDEGLVAMREVLLPLVFAATPNLSEAERLACQRLDGEASLRSACEAIKSFGCKHVVVTGGDASAGDAKDFLLREEAGEMGFEWLSGPRIQTRNTHGTGCAFATALACFLSEGFLVAEAVRRAKLFVAEALLGFRGERLGEGRGSIDHNFRLKPDRP